MNKPHKHAELIKAWADGAEIEFKSKTSGMWTVITEPIWDETFEYRVKTALPEGFAPWNGGKCPVHSFTKVDVVYRTGSVSYDIPAGRLRWSGLNFTHDIIGYRVVQKEPVVRWQWIYMDRTRIEPRMTIGFYKDHDEVLASDDDVVEVLFPAEWTRTEFAE